MKEADKMWPLSRREAGECGVGRAKAGKCLKMRGFTESTLCIWQHTVCYNVHEGSFAGMMKAETSLEKKKGN